MKKQQPKINANIIDGAISNPDETAHRLLECPLMGKHPLPYGDSRVRGFMIEMVNASAHWQHLEHDVQALVEPFQEFRQPCCNLFTLAVNQYPPTNADNFLLKPHVDRRYRSTEFDLDLRPVCTTIFFLAFPEGAIGGELVAFPNAAFTGVHDAIPREGARRTVAHYDGLCVEPIPGHACTLVGPVPHALIGYEAPEEGAWRLVFVLAQFSVPDGIAETATYRCISKRKP